MTVRFLQHRIKVFSSYEVYQTYPDGSRKRDDRRSQPSVEQQFNEWNSQMELSVHTVSPVSLSIVGKDADQSLHLLMTMAVVYALQEVHDGEEETSVQQAAPPQKTQATSAQHSRGEAVRQIAARVPGALDF